MKSLDVSCMRGIHCENLRKRTFVRMWLDIMNHRISGLKKIWNMLVKGRYFDHEYKDCYYVGQIQQIEMWSTDVFRVYLSRKQSLDEFGVELMMTSRFIFAGRSSENASEYNSLEAAKRAVRKNVISDERIRWIEIT